MKDLVRTWPQTAAFLIASVALAAPILPEAKSIPDEMRCLAGAKMVRVEFGEVPAALWKAGLRLADIKRQARRQLRAEGFRIVQGTEAPKVIVGFRAMADDSVPDATGFTAFLEIRQAVRVLRLDDEMILPTTTVLSYGLKKNDEVAVACLDHLASVLDKLVFFVNIATRSQEAEKKEAE